MAKSSDKADARWERTRQKLLEGGRKAFAETGVEAATVLEIVRAAGVSQPSFYNHFSTKAELAREIAAEFFRQDRRAKLAVFKEIDDPAEAIAINVDQTLSIASRDPVIAWTLVKSEALRELVISSSNDPLADMIRTGAARGRFKVDDPRSVALIIRAAALAIVQDILNDTADTTASVSFQKLVLQMLGLSPEESAEVVTRAQARSELGKVA